MARHCSIILCIAVAALVALGLIMLASTSAWVKGMEAPYHFLSRQTIMVVLGLIAAVVAARWPVENFRKLAPWMFVGACILLVLCYVPGIAAPELGSNRWIKAPFVGRFQPSELAKIVVVVCLSAWFARWQTEVHTFWRGFVIPGIIAGVPILLIAAETDVGTALSLSVAVGAVLFCVGTRLIYAVPTALAVISGACYYIANDVVRWKRIEAWLDLEKSRSINSIAACSSGAHCWLSEMAAPGVSALEMATKSSARSPSPTSISFSRSSARNSDSASPCWWCFVMC
jgi:cell division protein FtsW